MTNGTSQKAPYLGVKRILDIAFSLFLILAFFWLFPLIWLAITLTTAGTPIYVQNRLGKDKKQFKCYKFRTMQPDTPERGTHETSSEAVTQVGVFLRRSKLDELPQLYNVLLGDMSLVGPRPCLPVQEDVIKARTTGNVFRVKPGVTGLAQIRGVDMSNPNRLSNIDADYIASASLVLDFKILVATLFGRGGGDKVAVAKCCSAKSVDK